MKTKPKFPLRQLLTISFLLFFCFVPRITHEDLLTPDGKLSLFNIHTNELLNISYLNKAGQVDQAAISSISYLLRCPDTNEVHAIDPKLILMLDRVQDYFGKDKTVDIVCGYRSPYYNQLLRSRSEGVARFSYHMKGEAVDIDIPNTSLSEMYHYAWALHQGGVGFYPDKFIHIDIGPVRWW